MERQLSTACCLPESIKNDNYNAFQHWLGACNDSGCLPSRFDLGVMMRASDVDPIKSGSFELVQPKYRTKSSKPNNTQKCPTVFLRLQLEKGTDDLTDIQTEH